MKLLFSIQKNLILQLRDYWALILTLISAPFFVFVYYLISTTATTTYDVLVINNDKPSATQGANYGDTLISYLSAYKIPQSAVAFSVREISSDSLAQNAIIDKSADLVITIPGNFSDKLVSYSANKDRVQPTLKVLGNATNAYYSVSLILSLGVIQQYLDAFTGTKQSYQFIEEFTGNTANIRDFDIYMPGIFIFSIVMLILTCALLIIREVEDKSIKRLMITRMTVFDYIGGISVVQTLVGAMAFGLSLLTAIALGFQYSGSLLAAFVIGLITAISVIGISLLIVAFCNSITTVLTFGNIPLFILMFFSGAMMPMPSFDFIHIGGIGIAFNDLLPPTHAVNALNKVLISNMSLFDVRFDIYALIVLSLFYFILGLWLFKRRHLKVY